MKERPILFNSPMVRAILDGSKTQTRRVMKPQPEPTPDDYPGPAGHWWPSNIVQSMVHVEQELQNKHGIWGGFCPDVCPHGRIGDRLWVRETWQGPLFDGDQERAYHADPEQFQKPEFCVYAADGGPKPEFMTMDDEWVCRWRPSIHMPRWASRILLEIVSVRVERLQDISASDARAEGVESHEVRQFALFGLNAEERAELYRQAAIGPYRGLWESINGAGSWDANPWVWVIEFKRVTT